MKFDLSTTAFSAANLNNIPEAAAYFGDRDGHLTGFAMAVDEFGFIYLHGSSDSQLLAADGNEIVWIVIFFMILYILAR